MAEMTEAERQILYQHDLDVINRQANARIEKINAHYEEADKKVQALVDKRIAFKQAQRDKRKAGIKREWDLRLKNVRPGQEYKIDNINERYDGLSDLVDLEYENWFNDAAESQYKDDGEILKRKTEEIAKVNEWRDHEIGKEVQQLAAHTQRARRD
jgi:flagellar biosynthesis chaperone FliJ